MGVVTGFNPDVQLDHSERGAIAQTVGTPGYGVINRIMRSEVDKFIIDLINAPENDDRTVVAKHKLSKAAAQFYQAVIDRINYEIQLYTNAIQHGAKPSDVTEGLIDLGDPASTPADIAFDEGLLYDDSLMGGE